MPYTRRTALKTTAALGLAAAAAPRVFAKGKDRLSIALPELPYAVDALEPAIDARTMEIHHGRHHAGYTRNFQGALDRLPGVESVEELLGRIPELPEDLQGTVRNHGGGYWNHDLFWKVMAPVGEGGGRGPTGELAAAITAAFGSHGEFTNEFSEAAGGVFGSGWAWLTVRPDGRLGVVSTPNQDNPLMAGLVAEEDVGTPILGLDVWEHAYYLHYQNRRGDYISNWWNVVNWEEVNRRYIAARI